jgi:PleD family two-component response regulator
VGISSTELGEFTSFESLLDSSDRALYAAKSAGKNQVRVYSEELRATK